jgi:hypothetical protein
MNPRRLPHRISRFHRRLTFGDSARTLIAWHLLTSGHVIWAICSYLCFWVSAPPHMSLSSSTSPCAADCCASSANSYGLRYLNNRVDYGHTDINDRYQ